MQYLGKIFQLIKQFVALAALVSIGTHAYADSSCSATNSNGDQSCQISCPEGQAASCMNVSGSGTPLCECSGSSSLEQIMKGFKRNSTRANLTSANSRFRAALAENLPQQQTVEQTDLIAVINVKLAALGDKYLADNCHTVTPPCPVRYCPPSSAEYCDPYDRTCPAPVKTCEKVMGKLAVAPPLSIAKGPTVVLSEPNWKDIPSDVFAGHTHYINCSDVNQNDQVQYAVTKVTGETISKTKTLNTGRSEAAQISGQLKLPVGLTIGGSDSITVQTSTTYTDMNSENHSTQQQVTVTKPISYPAHTVVEGSFQSIRYNVPIPFTGTVTVDGGLNSNIDGLHTLSSVLPQESDRTFQFSGTLTDASLIDDVTKILQRASTTQDCHKVK